MLINPAGGVAPGTSIFTSVGTGVGDATAVGVGVGGGLTMNRRTGVAWMFPASSRAWMTNSCGPDSSAPGWNVHELVVVAFIRDVTSKPSSLALMTVTEA